VTISNAHKKEIIKTTMKRAYGNEQERKGGAFPTIEEKKRDSKRKIMDRREERDIHRIKNH